MYRQGIQSSLFVLNGKNFPKYIYFLCVLFCIYTFIYHLFTCLPFYFKHINTSLLAFDPTKCVFVCVRLHFYRKFSVFFTLCRSCCCFSKYQHVHKVNNCITWPAYWPVLYCHLELWVCVLWASSNAMIQMRPFK